MAQQEDKVTKIEEITSSQSKKSEKVQALDDSSVNPGQFEEVLNQQQKSANQNYAPTLTVNTSARTNVTLMDQVRDLNMKVNQVGKASPDALAGQAKSLIAQIEDVKEKLGSSNVEIKGSVQTLLRNKLSHINDNLRIALDKAGVEYALPNETAASQTQGNPVDRFLGLLTNGQYQLQHLSAELEQMSSKGVQLSPANMMSIQIKVNQVTQQIELFINLLNNAIQSTKTIMNVQV